MAKRHHQRDFLKSGDASFNPDLGRIVAEEDTNLSDYYVSPHKYAQRAMNLYDPAVFFVGPKGIGKSAILQMLKLNLPTEQSRIITISPDDLAFSALANIEASTPILIDINRNQWLFKSLWDYALSLEIVRREHRATGAARSFLNSFLYTQLKEREKLLNISLGDDGSPQTLSSRILQLVDEFEIAAQSEDSRITGKAKINPTSTAKGGHLKLLSLINSVAKKITQELKHPYYILIDDLDTYWTDTPLQNAFIAALFQSLRNFSKPPHLKCVVSMRDNIYRKLPITDRDKFRDWVCHIEWTKSEVKRMIEERIEKKLRCPQKLIWGELFPENGFDKLWKHTLGTPRELVRLTTLCLQQGRKNLGRQRLFDRK